MSRQTELDMRHATNIITYKGRRVPARIDETARVATIIETMARSFGASEQPITLCLRDSADVLITQRNLGRKVQAHEGLKLVPSPAIEAVFIAASLKRELAKVESTSGRASLAPSTQASPTLAIPRSSTLDINKLSEQAEREREGGTLSTKMALFNLSKYAKEEDFALDFMLKGGMKMLMSLLARDEGSPTGNSLAYALKGIRSLLDYDPSWSDLTLGFIDRLFFFICTSTAPNILLPTTAILRKIFTSSSYMAKRNAKNGEKKLPSTPMAKDKGKSKARLNDQDGPDLSVFEDRLAFHVLWDRLLHVGAIAITEVSATPAETVWKAVVRRLEGTGDLELVSQSLSLVNAAIQGGRHDGGPEYDDFVTLIEHLNVRKLVARLIPTAATQNIEHPILVFQTRYAGILQHRRLRKVRPREVPEHERMLSDVWSIAGLGREGTERNGMGPGSELERRTARGWARLGMPLQGEGKVRGEGDMFAEVGELGLECLHWFAAHDENLMNIIAEQQAKPEDRRCPIGRASIECVKILCEHYKLSSGTRTRSHFQTFLLQFPRLNHLLLTFFLRMWHESEAASVDFVRVSLLVRSHVSVALEDEASKSWLSLEQDLLDTEYRTIRERQMELLEKEDGMMDTDALRTLRYHIERDAVAVVQSQRVGCLLQGAWFNSAVLLDKRLEQSTKPNSVRPLRFVRLSPNRRYLAWSDFPTRPKSNPAFDVLRERVDVRTIAELREHTGHAINSRAPGVASKLSFSLLTSRDASILDLDAVHAAQYAEWVDGLRYVGRFGAGSRTNESEGYVQVLTELGLKIRMLDITGDGIEIPTEVDFGRAPQSSDFWFAK